MAERSPDITSADLDAVREAARAHGLDRYLSALLAPRELRADLISLAAFAGEIDRVPLLVSDAALGEVRLRWWLDWLEDLDNGSRTGNPVADVFGDVARRRRLPRDLIRGVIDTRGQELYGAPFSEAREYDDFLGRTDVALFQLAAEIAGGASATGVRPAGEPRHSADALHHFGKAYGGVNQLLKLPLQVQRGRWLLPSNGDSIDATRLADDDVRTQADKIRADAIASVSSDLQRARDAKGDLATASLVAGLPAALVGAYLKALEKQDDWLSSRADIAPLSRVWRLWRARWSRSI